MADGRIRIGVVLPIAQVEAGAEHLIASLDPCTEKTVAEFAAAVALFRAGQVAPPPRAATPSGSDR